MKLKSIVLSVPLILALALSVLPAAAETSGDFEYALNKDGTAAILRYTGKAEELTVPAALDGHKVKFIADGAFSGCGTLTGVTIPNSVQTVGANPFRSCEHLRSVKVSSGHPTLAVLDGVLFSKPDRRLVFYPMTKSPGEYEIPQGMRIIGQDAFYGCAGLTGVTIPDSVTDIGPSAFSYCDGLTGVTIPDSVTDIGAAAFAYCRALTDVSLPRGLTAVEAYLFSHCGRLTRVTVPDGVTAIEPNAFFHCVRLTHVTIPGSVTSIGYQAFAECGDLTALTIPAGVTAIDDFAFADCKHLTLTVSPGSYAARYCEENGLPYAYSDDKD